MELSVLVAKILALLYLSAGVGLLIGHFSLVKLIEDMEKSQALTFTLGLFSLIVGALLIEYHNRWVTDWTVVITLIGWGALIKGIIYIASPKTLLMVAKNKYQNSKTWGIFMTSVGIIFTYLGFFS